MGNICVVDKDNLSITQCTKLPQMPKGMFTLPPNFKCTAAQAADPTFWQGKLLAAKGVRIYKWPDFVMMTDNSDKAIYEVTPLADMSVRDGKYKFEFEIKKDLCLHKAMFSHRSQSGQVAIIDSSNQILMTQTGEDEFRGLTISLLNTEKLVFNNGTVASKSPIHLVLADNLEIDQNGVLIDASAFINTLIPLSDADVVVTKATTTVINVSVTSSCDAEPVVGLLTADFLVTKTSDGTAQTVTAVDNGDGTYTLSGSSLVGGSVNIRIASLLTVKGYESTGPFVFTVPFP